MRITKKLMHALAINLGIVGWLFLTSCSTARPGYLGRQSYFMPPGRAAAPVAVSAQEAATLFSDPAPSILVQPPALDQAMTVLGDQEERIATALQAEAAGGQGKDTEDLIEELRLQQLESWKQAPSLLSLQSEPLLLEEVLRLTIVEDSRLAADLKKLLQVTKSDLPLALNEHVLKYVNYFRGRGSRTLAASLRRAGAYKAMISRVLGDEGVPQDLIYLVQAESGFRATARSRKRATGMWQFIAGRGREYGLAQDRLVDERLDPEKATTAAARHLSDLHGQFGDWYLAMAAYNCGPGCVQKAVERTGYADYWELVRRKALPKETSNYVPVILAMALLAKNTDAFGIEVIPEEPIHYDTVETNSRIGLHLIADATGTTADRIKDLNPALLGSATPARQYSLRIPKNMAEPFQQDLAVVPETGRQTWRRHQVQEDETLSQIATRYRVKASEIARLNSLGPQGPGLGDRLTIPVPSKASRTVYAVAPPRSGRRSIGHRVQPGDTLAKIARQY